MDKAVIFGASVIRDYSSLTGYIDENSIFICADGGIVHAVNLGITPEIVIGDFDSFINEIPYPEAVIIRYDPKKDFTDTELAIMEAVKDRVSDITLFGCIYGRMDQTIANIQLLLKYTRRGIKIKIVGEDDVIMVVNKSTKIEKKPGFYISLFALSDVVEELTLRGTKYLLDKYMLYSGDAIGVSNEFEAEQADISFLRGELLVILSRRKEN